MRYRRIGATDEVTLTSTLRSVDLERVGAKEGSKNSLVNGVQGVDLKRVGGAYDPLSTPALLRGQVTLRAA